MFDVWRSLYPDAAATLTMPHASVSLAGRFLLPKIGPGKRRSVCGHRRILCLKVLVLAWFENDPGWAPSQDGNAGCARMPLI